MAFSNAASRSVSAEYFKRVYANANLVPQTLRDTVTLKNITMLEHSFGEVIVEPLVTAMPTGGAAKASRAILNAYGSNTKAWNLQPKTHFEVVNIPALDQALSEGREGSYLSLKKQEADNVLAKMGMDYEKALWSDGNGEIAQISSFTGTGTSGDPWIIQLGGGQAYNIHKNSTLTFNSARTGGTNRDNLAVVTKVLDATDVIHAVRGTTFSTAGVLVAGDYVFVDGDHGDQNAAASSNLLLTGIPAYIPSQDPGTGSVPAVLNNVDRTERPSMLSGWRVTQTGGIAETCKALIALMGRYAKIDPSSAFMMSANNWKKLEEELASKAYRDEKAEARFNTGAIMVYTGKGMVPAIMIPVLDDSSVYFGSLSTVRLRHVKKFPHLRMDGGVSSVRLGWENDQDGERIEFRSWAECCISDPSRWGRFLVTA